MVLKTIFMVSVCFTPLIIVNTGLVSSPMVLFLLYGTSGLGMAGMGMGIMHDANHGSYAKSRRLNKYLAYSMNLIGGNATVWKIQHNVLHHTYTNIDMVDEDIGTPFFLRFSPHAKRHWLHRFQHLYVWFFYGLSTLSWVVFKDFTRLGHYQKMGFFKGKNEFRTETLKLAAWKLLYFSYTLALPLIVVPLAPWIIILAFVAMHFVSGVSLSIVFQTAHVMPSNEFPLPDKSGLIANDWAIHQMATTGNYSPRSRFFSWLIGGLNYQIEHHLLPNVCHIHYKKLSHIVAETAQEYGLPYNSKKTFLAAIRDHIKMLRRLGMVELAPAK